MPERRLCRLSPFLRWADNPGPPDGREPIDRQGGNTFRDTFLVSHNGWHRALELIFPGVVSGSWLDDQWRDNEPIDRQGGNTFRDTFLVSHNGWHRALELIF